MSTGRMSATIHGSGLALIFGIAAASATQLAAQTPPPRAELPDSVAHRVVDFYNAPGTIRVTGETLIASGSEVAGPIAVLRGPIVHAGRIQGDLVVINGDLRFEPGAIISGNVTVVGGGLIGADNATVGGRTAHYLEPLRFRHRGADLAYDPEPAPELSAGREFAFGRTDLLLAVRGAYNRVEGLPISVGPRLRLGRSNPTLLEGLLIYRTTAGLRLDPDQLGYAIHAQQYLGGGRTARIGLRLFSEVTPIEQWGLSDRENSLATFLLHRDYRDAYRREGFATYVRFARPGWPHDLTVEYRDERHWRVMPASPWSLIDNEEPWRPQPLIAEGDIRSVAARLSYDTRNDAADPSNGWHIVAEVEQGLGGFLRPALSVNVEQPDDPPAGTAFSRERYTAGLFDARRYVRLGPASRAALRLVAAGSVDGTVLPPQRQQALGGEGSLPGYPLFAFDCGARSIQVQVDSVQYYPFYGCDRLALIRLEYEGNFPFARRLSRSAGLDIGEMFRWVLFFDAGRAWTEPGARSGRLPGSEDLSADAGLGLRIGRAGIYWAVPFSGRGSFNFFVRIGRPL